MFRDAVLDIHPAALGILLLAADGFGVAEIVGIFPFVVKEIFVIKQVGCFGCSHEQPSFATEFPTVLFSFFRFKHATQVGAHGGDPGAGGQHDHVCFFVLGKQHFLANRPCDLDLGAGLNVA